MNFLQAVYASLTQEQAISNEYSSQSSSCSGSDGGFPVALREQLGMLLSALPTNIPNGIGSPSKETHQNGAVTDGVVTRKPGILGKGTFFI